MLIPQVVKIRDIIDETADIKTFVMEGQPLEYKPGQCAILSLPDQGEAIFSISSSPTQEHMEFSIKRVGLFTEKLHGLVSGQKVALRGPFGNGFPVDVFRGKDLLFVGGGIGLAPLRSLINYTLDHRNDYRGIQIIYGARTPEDVVFPKEVFHIWPQFANVEVTVDVGDTNWTGHVGVVTKLLEGLTNQSGMSITCGPPVMIKFVLVALKQLGFAPEEIITTLEKKMKCGIGQCGRCNIGCKYVCQDGPVFSLAQLQNLPDEL